MEYIATATIILPIIFVLLFLNVFRKSHKHNHPPGPKPLPIIGNIHLLGNKPHQSVAKLSKIYGPLMRLKLGSVNMLVISSPEVAKEMFVKHDLAFSGRPAFEAFKTLDHHKHSLIMLPVCPKWRHLRKIMTIQLFTNQRLNASQALRQKKVDELVEYARGCSQKGLAIDIGKAAFTTTLNLMSNTIFSFDMCSHDSLQSRELKELIWNLMEERAKPNLSDYFPLFKHFDLQGIQKRVTAYFNKMFGLLEEIINERLRDPAREEKSDVLSALLKLIEDNEITLVDAKHMLPGLFVAGTDTSSSTIEWAMTELLRRPEKMAKAQSEIDQVVGKDGLVRESDINKLLYVQAIVKETLRMHSPTPFLLPHRCMEDVQILGYHVAKDTLVWVNVWWIGRDPRVWPNAESFEPERFLDSKIDMKGQDFELIPFGAGRRICAGMPLAFRMVHLMLATLIHSFNWKLGDGLSPQDIDMDEKFGITLRKVEPLLAIPLSR